MEPSAPQKPFEGESSEPAYRPQPTKIEVVRPGHFTKAVLGPPPTLEDFPNEEIKADPAVEEEDPVNLKELASKGTNAVTTTASLLSMASSVPTPSSLLASPASLVSKALPVPTAAFNVAAPAPNVTAPALKVPNVGIPDIGIPNMGKVAALDPKLPLDPKVAALDPKLKVPELSGMKGVGIKQPDSHLISAATLPTPEGPGVGNMLHTATTAASLGRTGHSLASGGLPAAQGLGIKVASNVAANKVIEKATSLAAESATVGEAALVDKA